MWTALLPLPLLVGPLPVGQDPFQNEIYRTLASTERITPEVLVVQAAKPSVVYIETEIRQQMRDFFGFLREQTYGGSGSGVVIHAEGYIVTNYHVVKGADRIIVSFDRDPHRYAAELISFVQSEDLALLKIDAQPGRDPGEQQTFPTVRMGTSADLMEGERVVAIGNPYGQTHTVSTGIISGLHRDVPLPRFGLHFQDLIQTDASINFGNSGGPLLNVRGELIGINSAMNAQAENIGFAIPVDRVREVLSDILYPQARRSWMGFELATGETLTVAQVWPDGPADRAGVCQGDQVLALGGRPVADREEFLHASLEVEPNQAVEVSLRKVDGQRVQVPVDTWDRLDGLLFERLGMTVREGESRGRSWILVDRISQGGPADQLGLERGDMIPAVRPLSGRMAWRIRDRRTLVQVVSQLEPGAKVQLDVYRDDDGDREFARDEFYQGLLTLR